MKLYTDLFNWDYFKKTTWVDLDDLPLLRQNGREWLFGDSDFDKAATRLFSGVLAMFFDQRGYDVVWWGAPSVKPDGSGWDLIDNHAWIENPDKWFRIPKRRECMAAMQLWTTRTVMRNTQKGKMMRELALGTRSVETLTMHAVARSDQALSLHMGFSWEDDPPVPGQTDKGPQPWTEVEKILR